MAIARVHADGGVDGLGLFRDGAVVVDHLLVSGDVARRKDDALRCDDLLVPVGRIENRADHPVALFHELYGRRFEQELDPLVLHEVIEQLDGEERVLIEIGNARSPSVDGEHMVARLVGQKRIARIAVPEIDLDVVGLGLFEQPVHRLARLLEEEADERFVRAVSACLHPAERRRRLIGHFRALLDRVRRVDDAGSRPAAVRLCGLLGNDYLQSIFGGRQGRGKTRIAGADHEHLGFDGLCDIAIRYRRRRRHERRLARRCLRAVSRGAAGSFRRSPGRRAADQTAQRRSRTGNRRTGEKSAPRKALPLSV